MLLTPREKAIVEAALARDDAQTRRIVDLESARLIEKLQVEAAHMAAMMERMKEVRSMEEETLP